MQYINVLNFVELSSVSMLKVVDFSFDNGYYQDNTLFIDLKKKPVKDLFYNTLKNEIDKHTTFGKTNIIVNSCKSNKNWRYQNFLDQTDTEYSEKINQSIFSTHSYKVVDDHEKIMFASLDSLQLFLDYMWIRLWKDRYNTYSHCELDYLDIIKVLYSIIGKNYVNIPPNNFLILRDINFDYGRKFNDVIPKYLVDNVNTFCHSMGLM